MVISGYAAAFTRDTYGHVTERMRRQGAEKMNDLLKKMEDEEERGEAIREN